ncbi:NAD-dependent epimerase/dehydratase family protein [Flagellimonas sp. GZD32]|uniref:NAD-dependent epimerase/dehydratase family protein n=1 Tax=Flagellimonas cixiensis TaxID=3228750 RepID=UPI0035C8B658
MKILVTGAAGFIGFHVCNNLLKGGHEVVGLDNINGYYDVKLKFARLSELGISQIDATPFNILCKGKKYGDQFRFVRMNLEDREKVPKLFRKEKFDVVCSLAAQAGVRFSIENPEPYIDSNVVGFLNILECCKNFDIKHLVYASSSSVYGLNKEIPFSTHQKTDEPISLYAATKKSNELMAHVYSHLFELPTTGLRFFTVYGPWGRPDMALHLFTDAMVSNKAIKVFNKGLMERDFTYIDDIVDGILKVIQKPQEKRLEQKEFYKIYNIGNSKSVPLMQFITELENSLNITAIKDFQPIQPGDVLKTWADITEFEGDYDYHPTTNIKEGIEKFVTWYKSYYLSNNTANQ